MRSSLIAALLCLPLVGWAYVPCVDTIGKNCDAEVAKMRKTLPIVMPDRWFTYCPDRKSVTLKGRYTCTYKKGHTYCEPKKDKGHE